MTDDTKALAGDANETFGDPLVAVNRKLRATIERLERELAEARRDAERYRWLRTIRHRQNGAAHYADVVLDGVVDRAIAAMKGASDE